MPAAALRRTACAATAGVAVATTTLTPPAEAQITAPPGLDVGDKFHLVFVTTSTATATSTDVSFYDGIVQSEAAAQGLASYGGQPVTWQALASIGDNPATVEDDAISGKQRFDPASPVFKLDGTRVADNGADLWDTSIQSPVNVSSDLSTLSATVWTGTGQTGDANKALGAVVVDPNNGPELRPTVGLSGDSTGLWVDSNRDLGTAEHPFYAFSSELTVTPEPSSAALVAAAVTLTGLARRRGSRSR